MVPVFTSTETPLSSGGKFTGGNKVMTKQCLTFTFQYSVLLCYVYLKFCLRCLSERRGEKECVHYLLSRRAAPTKNQEDLWGVRHTAEKVVMILAEVFTCQDWLAEFRAGDDISAFCLSAHPLRSILLFCSAASSNKKYIDHFGIWKLRP